MKKKNLKISALRRATDALLSAFNTNVKQKRSTVKFKFEIVEDVEGLVLVYPELELGAPVEIAGSEGSEKAPDGWYKIDGDIEILVNDAEIVEIKYPEGFDEAEVEEDNKDVKNEIVDVIDSMVEEMEALKDEVKAVKDSVDVEPAISVEEIEDLKADIKSLTEAVIELSGQPHKFSKNTKNTNPNSLEQLAGILGKNKRK